MKRLSVLASFLCCSLSVNAELSLKEIRTASNNILVAYFKSTVIQADEVNTVTLSAWKLNGQPVMAVNKFVTEADACDHHIYLQVPPLVNGTSYSLQTPHGDTTFVFDDRRVFCESVKTNQNAKQVTWDGFSSLYPVLIQKLGRKENEWVKLLTK